MCLQHKHPAQKPQNIRNTFGTDTTVKTARVCICIPDLLIALHCSLEGNESHTSGSVLSVCVCAYNMLRQSVCRLHSKSVRTQHAKHEPRARISIALNWRNCGRARKPSVRAVLSPNLLDVRSSVGVCVFFGHSWVTTLSCGRCDQVRQLNPHRTGSD